MQEKEVADYSGPSISAHNPSTWESVQRFGRDFHRGTEDTVLESTEGLENSLQALQQFGSDLLSDPGQALADQADGAIEVAGAACDAAEKAWDDPGATIKAIGAAVWEPYGREIEAGHSGAALGRVVTNGLAGLAAAILAVGPAAAAGGVLRRTPDSSPDIDGPKLGGGSHKDSKDVDSDVVAPLANDAIVVFGSTPKSGAFKIRPGIDTRPIGNITQRGKSVSEAVTLELSDEFAQMFGADRGIVRGDTLAGAFVEDIRAAGFDVVMAPTTRNTRHARIIETTGSFDNPESLEMLSIAFDRLARARKSSGR